MNKTIIIYSSKYGFTKTYAQWLSEELSCEMLSAKKANASTLTGYDTIIYGGGLYAGTVSGIKLLTENISLLKDKNIVIFTCGLADPKNENNVTHIRNSLSSVFSEEAMAHIRHFHLQGGIDYSRLSLLHRAMMAMMNKMLKSKSPEELTEEDKGMLAAYKKAADFTDRMSITPIVEYVKSLPSRL